MRRVKRPSGRWSRSRARSSPWEWCCRSCSSRACFISGIVGVFFKQFALTIAASTLISTFNSLTLSPALCAFAARSETGTGTKNRTSSGRGLRSTCCLLVLRGLFNRAFAPDGRGTSWSSGCSGHSRAANRSGDVCRDRRRRRTGNTRRMPTGFIPQQDKGYLLCQHSTAGLRQRPSVPGRCSARSAESPWTWNWRTQRGTRSRPARQRDRRQLVRPERLRLELRFDVHHSRRFRDRASDRELDADAVITSITKSRSPPRLPEAQINMFGATAVSGSGRAGGFRIMIEDRGDVGAESAARDKPTTSSRKRISSRNGRRCSRSSRRTRRKSDTSTWIGGVLSPAGLNRPTCAPRCRRRWAAAMRTTSIASAEPGK